MVIYASADLLGSSIGLVLSPIFTRLFTPEQYGAQAALGAIWGFVALAQYGGMDSAYPNFRSRTSDEAERRRVLVSASCLAVLSTLIVSGAFGLVGMATQWITSFAGISRRELFTYVLTLAPGGIMSWFLYVLRYERRAAAFARVSLLGRVFGAVVLIPILFYIPQMERMSVGFMISAVVTLLAAGVGFRELRRQGLSPFTRPEYDASKATAMLRFGLVLVPGFAIYAASTVLDRLMVTWFSGPAETATLALALRLGAIAVMLRTWFALVWDPQLMEWIPTVTREVLFQRLNDATSLIVRVVCILAALAALWTEPVVKLLYPSAFWTTIPLVPWIVLGVGMSTLSLVAVATTTIAQTSKLHLPVYCAAW
jgi:O-antigen/teichoic acid export membrane protein